MTVDDLVAFLEENFYGSDEVKIFDSKGDNIDLEPKHIASVKKNMFNYALIDKFEDEE